MLQRSIAFERHEALLHQVREIAPLLIEVPLLERIALQVVQLTTWRLDELESAGSKRPERAPAESLGIERLGVGFEIDVPGSAVKEIGEADAVGRGTRHADQIQHGWHHVNEAYNVAHPARRHIRRPHNQRHVEDALINEDPVVALTVIPSDSP